MSRIDCTRQRTVQGAINRRYQIALGIERFFLANTVEDYHRIVHRVTDNRQYRSDKVLIDFHREGQNSIKQRVQAHYRESGKGYRNQRTRTERDVAESEQDIQSHRNQREKDCPIGSHLNIVGNSRAYLLAALNHILGKLFVGSIAQQALHSLVEFCFDFTVNLLAVIGNTVIGRDTHLIAARDGDYRQRMPFERRFKHIFDFERAYRLFKSNHVVTASREIDTLIHSTSEERNDKHGYYGQNADITYLAQPYEIDVGIGEEITRNSRSESHIIEFPAVQTSLENETGDKDSRKERSSDTDNQGCGKAQDGTRSINQQNHTRDDRGQVRVEDCRECILVTIGNRRFHILTRTQFFFGTLENQHVGIDRHSQRQHDTGNTRKGEHGLQRGKNTHSEEKVAYHTEAGNKARRPAVHDNQIGHQQHQSDQERNQSVLNSLLAQRRTDDVFLYNRYRSCHLTRIEHIGQVFGLFGRESARNLRATARDGLVYIGERIYLIVEHDSDGVADVVAGQFLPRLGTLGIHGHAHDRTLQFVEIVTSVGNHIATQRGFATLAGLQGDELVHGLFLVDGFHRPAQDKVAGQDVAGNLAGQHAVYGSRIVFVHNTDYRRTAVGLCIVHQRKQRILFAETSHHFGIRLLFLQFGFQRLSGAVARSGSGSSRRVGCSRCRFGNGSLGSYRVGSLAGIGSSQSVVYSIEFGNELVELISFPKLEVCATLQQFSHTFGLFDTRQFYRDKTVFLQLLDIGSNHAEAVDTRAQYIIRVVYRAVQFVAQNSNYLFVGRTGRYLIF